MEHGIVLESVWVAVGFVVFVALVWRKVGAALGGMLDERSAKIRADLDEAQALRDEALAELKNYQRLHLEAANEAKAIVKAAEAREDSRGAHFRSDFPETRELENSWFTRVTFEGDDMAVERVAVNFSIVKPGKTLLVEAAAE